ncbi:uncharacterized protein [Rutidosis leptorrhynchoides]|uniref:uncharacterized protein n=1 Tax=Rutidosis leptorrhynchoides TaxID=125765 RepID=UPI003A9999AA
MNILSINIGGGASFNYKQSWIRGLCNEYKIDVLGIQETKLTKLDVFIARSFWGNNSFEVASSCARGRSGGLLTFWDPLSFYKSCIFSYDNVLIVEGSRPCSQNRSFIVNVYAPQDRASKNRLWKLISDFIHNNSGDFFIFGDFNSVRGAHERFGLTFCPLSATEFNDFISTSCLVDFPMGGRNFTRSSKSCDSRAKLDRFLLSNSVMDSCLDLVGHILPNLWSDHCPIVIFNEHLDYGPTSFKLFASWFLMDGFEKVIQDVWNDSSIAADCVGINPFFVFKNKLKHVKLKLKEWSKIKLASCGARKKLLLSSIDQIDNDLANGGDRIQLSREKVLAKRSCFY